LFPEPMRRHGLYGGNLLPSTFNNP